MLKVNENISSQNSNKYIENSSIIILSSNL